MNLLDHLRTGAPIGPPITARMRRCWRLRRPIRGGVTGFPSLAGTAGTILAVILYIAALHREADMVAQYERFAPCRSVDELAERQRASDERLIAFVDSLGPDDLSGEVVMDRGDTKQVDRVAPVLAHLAMHQTHHRGQAHAMLSGTTVRPPQLDEFLMPSDAPLRVADLQALGWSERDLFDGR